MTHAKKMFIAFFLLIVAIALCFCSPTADATDPFQHRTHAAGPLMPVPGTYRAYLTICAVDNDNPLPVCATEVSEDKFADTDTCRAANVPIAKDVVDHLKKDGVTVLSAAVGCLPDFAEGSAS